MHTTSFPTRALIAIFILAVATIEVGWTLSPEAALGKLAFHDPILSASGQLSCASCHAAQTGHAAANNSPVSAGGIDMQTPGVRSAPSLRYLATNTPFHFDKEGTPTGGFFWDGRVDTLAEQAAAPLLGKAEMANANTSAVAANIAKTQWATTFQSLYGKDILQHPDNAFDNLTQALQQYQLEDTAFHSYTSKYDAFLRNETALTEQESRGLDLFNDPDKGNCAACHPSRKDKYGNHPLFTDFSYDVLGIPRNPAIAANADPAYFDNGLCGHPKLHLRQDLCGAFKVPSLRNVALRHSYFHNGAFTSLTDAITFYVERDTNPDKWYPKNSNGTVYKFNDLRPEWRDNVNTDEAPYDRKFGDTPALNADEIADVVAFLNTLTDGWHANAE